MVCLTGIVESQNRSCDFSPTGHPEVERNNVLGWGGGGHTAHRQTTHTYTQKHTHTTTQGHAQTNTRKHKNFWLRMLTTQYVRPDSSFSVGQFANVMGNDVAKSLVENGAIIFARWSWCWWLWWCWKQPCSEWGNYLEEVEPSPLQSYPFPQDHRPCDPSED